MANSKVIDLAALATFKTLQDLANAATFARKDGDKVLSTNDFTDANKAQLAELTANLGGYQVADDVQIQSVLVEVFGS